MSRLLDLYSGAGGAAKGYAQAGFEVVGVDIASQPRYPFPFIQDDALVVLEALLRCHGIRDSAGGVHRLADFAAIHASPPCQHYANVTAWRGNQADHPALIEPTRTLLDLTGKPWVMENVPGSPLVRHSDLFGHHGTMICGTMVGLGVRRHRLFETNFPIRTAGRCNHQTSNLAFDHGGKQPESEYRAAMGCAWMTVGESREAVPPAYTLFVGKQLCATVDGRQLIEVTR